MSKNKVTLAVLEGQLEDLNETYAETLSQLKQFYEGRTVEIISKYNGQVVGRSKPALTGRRVVITHASLWHGADSKLRPSFSADLIGRNGERIWLQPCLELSDFKLIND